MPRLLITGPLFDSARPLLEARSDVEVVVVDPPAIDAIRAEITEADAVVLRYVPFGRDIVALAPRLKVVSRFGVGYDNVDVAALSARGIALTVIGEANALSVAEATLALLLASARRLPLNDRLVRQNRWHDREMTAQSDLAGKTVLIVGFGRIGRRVARRLLAFETEVLVADPNVPAGEVEAAGCRPVDDFRAALPRADFVTLHLPGAADGSPLVGPAEFAAMKPGARLVNLARGSLVDESALYRALTEGTLAGAALDVLVEEPPAPDNPLLALDSVVLSPHIAAGTAECVERMCAASIENALAGIDGRLDPAVVVNREVLGEAAARRG